MSCCAAGKSRTPLELYARWLPDDADAAPIFFPMYTVTSDLLLKMTNVEPHEKLKARGELVVFHEDLGRAVFISHQWLAKRNPDPDLKQMRILQAAVQRFLTSPGSIPLDAVTEVLVPNAKPLPMKEFQMEALFVWYDYFSCPQWECHVTNQRDDYNQANAISSIPGYIAKCKFFVALCPTIECPWQGKVLSATSWRRRGWCIVERASRELSKDSTWILVQSDVAVEVVGTVVSFVPGSVGEAEFTNAEDRRRLAPVMRHIVMQKLKHCLRAGDLAGFRRHFNLQGMYLRGLEIEPVRGLLPRHGADAAPGDQDVVMEFLHQNGLRKIGEVDSAGWRPLHYAALAGSCEVLKGLLNQRVDVNKRTSKDEPTLGFPPWISALDLAVYYKHHEAARLLLAAKAQLDGGISPSMHYAAISDNAEGVRLLHTAGSGLLAQNLFGVTAFQAAATYAAMGALEEMLVRDTGGLDTLELSTALWCATAFRGGSAQLVQRLINSRAEVDFQFSVPRAIRPVGRLFFAAKSLQHWLGWTSLQTAHAYHQHGSTPLMQAIRMAQWEAAASLIAAGARTDIRNGRNWTAADFARGKSVPHFLQMGLDGDPCECRRVSSLALSDSYVEVYM